MLRRIFSKIIGRFFESILAASMMASLSFFYQDFLIKIFPKKDYLNQEILVKWYLLALQKRFLEIMILRNLFCVGFF